MSVDRVVRAADERDRRAEVRDRRAEQRDVAADARARDGGTSSEEQRHAAADRQAAAVDRLHAGRDRDAAASDRAALLALPAVPSARRVAAVGRAGAGGRTASATISQTREVLRATHEQHYEEARQAGPRP